MPFCVSTSASHGTGKLWSSGNTAGPDTPGTTHEKLLLATFSKVWGVRFLPTLCRIDRNRSADSHPWIADVLSGGARLVRLHVRLELGHTRRLRSGLEGRVRD